MINVNLWENSTKSIFTGVLLYSICGIVVAILGFFTVTSAGALTATSSGSGLGIVATLGALIVIASILMVVGYFKYFNGIGRFRDAVEEADKPSVQKLYIAIILLIVGTIVEMIPFIGFIGKIINIVAYILMFLAYKDLSVSTSFPELARRGTKNLYVAMILSLCAVILSWIPAIKIVAEAFSIVSFIIVFMGWGKVKNALN